MCGRCERPLRRECAESRPTPIVTLRLGLVTAGWMVASLCVFVSITSDLTLHPLIIFKQMTAVRFLPEVTLKRC